MVTLRITLKYIEVGRYTHCYYYGLSPVYLLFVTSFKKFHVMQTFGHLSRLIAIKVD